MVLGHDMRAFEMQNKLNFNSALLMRLCRALIVAGVVFTAAPVAALAESYQCNLKVSKTKSTILPKTLRIDWPNYLGPARITDTISKANGLKRVFAHAPIETKAKVQFNWKLNDIYVPNLSLLTGAIAPNRVNVTYRATVYPSKGRVVITADPQVIYTYSAFLIRAQGRCKVIK